MEKSFKQKLCDFDKKGLVFPLFPHRFKWVSIAIILLTAIGFFVRTQLDLFPEFIWRHLFKSFLLLGLLVFILCKEKQEDERIKNLRFRAFAFAFVFSMLMFILLPFVSFLKDWIQMQPTWEKEQNMFYIFSMMMFFQIMYFYIFKRQL